jgi:hypothetical protein
MVKNFFVAMWLRCSLSPFGRFLGLDTLPVKAVATDRFTRFLFHSNQFRENIGRVTPIGLLPIFNKGRQRWETSTHRIDGLPPALIWALGYRYVETLPHRRIKARASGEVALVTAQNLQYEVNGRPYPRHADIIGWSADDKDVRMMAATEIANHMTLQVRTSS